MREPGKTTPQAILLSSLLVMVPLTGVHLVLVGVIPWQEIATNPPERDAFNLPAEFMRAIHGDWAASLMALLLVWSCFGSVFAAVLDYSRIP